MTTEKQIEANKKNAQLSTGPRTQEGKMIVSQNAVRHAILSKKMYVSEGLKEDFTNLQSHFYNEFIPQNHLEEILLDRAISSAWRLSLIMHIESEIFRNEARSGRYSGEDQIKGSFDGYGGGKMILLSRYETFLEKSFYKAITSLKELQKDRKNQLLHEEVQTIIVEDLSSNGFVS